MIADEQPADSPYLRAYNGRLKGVLRWPDLDAVWTQLQRHGDDTGPQAEGYPRRRLFGPRGRHWQARRFPRAFCSV